MKFELERLSQKYLTLILEWRNQDRIRKNMYNEKKITTNEHLKWYENVIKSKKDIYFTYLVNEEPVGVIYFNNINTHDSHCNWGFYIGKSSTFQGAGTVMGILGLKYIFEELGIHKVYGEVLATNIVSIKYHEKLGFIKEGYLKQHINKNNIFNDVIIYGLIQNDWYQNQYDHLIDKLQKKGIDLFGDNCNSS